ncbi:hypothetical protein GC173_00925 [bacterium]|nr:hypothetical protein [bacterium]
MTALGALSRPSISSAITADSARLIGRVLDRASVPLVRPLLIQHIGSRGLLEAAGLEKGECTAELRHATREWAQRRFRLDDLLTAAAAKGLAAPVLVQGTGLAPLYPSPALRTTADLDLLVSVSDYPRWKPMLRRLGWSETPSNWVHEDGTNLDLHIPATPLAGKLLAQSTPHPAIPAALLPPEHLHLVLIARHAARHQADRLWRDVADINLLLGRSTRPDRLLAMAWDVAPEDTREPLAGLLRFVDRWSRPLGPSWQQSQVGEQFLLLCEGQALSPTGAAELDLLEPVFHRRATRPAVRSSSDRSSIRRVDSQLGMIPRPGLALTMLRLRLIAKAAFGGRLSALRRRIAQRRNLRIAQSDFA